MVRMKKIFAIFLVFILLLSASCGGKVNPKISKLGITSADIERITITNNKFSGKYTIIDKQSINRFINYIVRSKDSTEDSKLTPDFTFDLFDNEKKVASFKYIAEVDDSSTANLIDTSGSLYHVDSSIEDEFIKRLMKKDSNKNVDDYYESTINRVIEKTDVKPNSTIAVDISKDYLVTKSITSMEQKKILDSIQKDGIKINNLQESEKYDYLININTKKYNDSSSEAYITVTDSKNVKVVYVFDGTYNDSKWSYAINYK